jgi:hypothetical protein
LALHKFSSGSKINSLHAQKKIKNGIGR